MIYYLILKKHFKFLIDDYDFKIAHKQRMGYIGICYENSQLKISITDFYDNIRISISEAGTYCNATEYLEEFKTVGNYYKKAKIASEWLKEKIEQEKKSNYNLWINK